MLPTLEISSGKPLTGCTMSGSGDVIFKTPKSKKHSNNDKHFCLPVITSTPVVGVFNGLNVVVTDWDSMNIIHRGGFFGKGSLSKGAPLHHLKKDDLPRVVFKNQFNKMLEWNNRAYYKCPKKYLGYLKNDLDIFINSIEELLKFSFENNSQECWKSWKKSKNQTENDENKKSLSTSNPTSFLEFGSDAESYKDGKFCEMVEEILFTKQGKKYKFFEKNFEEVIVVNDSVPSSNDLDVRLERLSYLAEENLNLSLEESFFLKFATNSLNILDLNLKPLGLPALWKTFNSLNKDFFVKYVIYHYYRTKGWIVKSGLKFGGQYLLYKHGPAFYHSTYLIQVLDKRKKMEWKDFVGMNRLVETYNKDLVLCSVQPTNPLIDEETFPKGLKNVKVQEVLARRWFPSKERF